MCVRMCGGGGGEAHFTCVHVHVHVQHVCAVCVYVCVHVYNMYACIIYHSVCEIIQHLFVTEALRKGWTLIKGCVNEILYMHVCVHNTVCALDLCTYVHTYMYVRM